MERVMTQQERAPGSHRAAFFIHENAYRYDFGPRHPLQSIRLRALVDLVEKLGLFDGESSNHELIAPVPASDEELQRIHTSEYVNVVRRLSAAAYPLRGADAELAVAYGLGHGDTPAFPGMHESSSAIAGATIAAVRSVLRGERDHAFSPSGGLHHAMAGNASGFCIYNDASIGIAAAVKEFEARVLYLDFDAHHGDGVQAAFYSDPRVVTVSFHESGRYLFPGSGGTDERGTGDGAGCAVNV